MDAAMLAFGMSVAAYGPARADDTVQVLTWSACVAVLVLVLLAGRGEYRVRLRVSLFDQFRRVVTAVALATMTVIAARVLLAPDPAIAAQTVRSWGSLWLMLAGGRVVFAIVDARSPGLSTLIVGAGQVGRTVARRLQERPELGLVPVGFLDKDPREGLTADLPVLGASWDLEDVVRRFGVEHVIVTFSRAPHDVLLGVMRRARAQGIEVSLVPRLFEEVSDRVTVQHLGGVALLRVRHADVRGWQFAVKYAIDRVVSALAVLVLAPVLVGLALVVKLSSPGPVFFRQRRIGLNGAEFDILKFRTMRVAEGGSQENEGWASRSLGFERAGVLDLQSSPRRTRVGSVLRKYSLDELPQLVNVVRGDMSLVGPRPEQSLYVDAFAHHIYRYSDRHRVKSGLTGWAQVQGLRGATSLAERVEWDNFYVENWSPTLDLKILLMTLPAVLRGSLEK